MNDATAAARLAEQRLNGREPPAPLRIIDPITLHGVPVPQRRWIVLGWIPYRAVTMLNADGAVGKTQLAAQLCTAAATRNKWLGQVVAPVKAIGIFCEDDPDELHRRQEAINRHYDLSFLDLENYQWCSRVGEDNRIDVDGQPTGLYDLVREWALVFGA